MSSIEALSSRIVAANLWTLCFTAGLLYWGLSTSAIFSNGSSFRVLINWLILPFSDAGRVVRLARQRKLGSADGTPAVGADFIGITVCTDDAQRQNSGRVAAIPTEGNGVYDQLNCDARGGRPHPHPGTLLPGR